MARVPSSDEITTSLAGSRVENATDLEQSVENLVYTNVQIIAELKSILEAIHTYRKRTNVVKTAGTTIGVTGAIALCAAPFTAGLSTTLGVGGMVATGTSAVTSLGSNFVYKRKIKSFSANIEKLEEKQKIAAQELTLKFNVIHSVMEALIDQSGVDEHVAFRTTLYHIGKKTVKLVAVGCDRIIKDSHLVNEALQQVTKLRDIAVAIIVSRGLSPQEVYYDLTSPVINGALRLGQSVTRELSEFQVLVKSAGESLKDAAAGVPRRTVLKGVGASIAVIFSIIDIALLVRDWTHDEPLVETINATIEQLQDDIGKCADILRVLRTYEGEQTNEEQPMTTSAILNNNEVTEHHTNATYELMETNDTKETPKSGT